MRITESHLRRIIRRQIQNIFEENKPKTGSATSDVEGSVDTKKLADAIDVDPGKLKTAVTNLRAKKRNTNDDKVFGDVFAKLLDASEQDTVKAMAVLKKVHAEEDAEEE